MDFSDPPRRPQRESVVPMINVVFLLLIFFLMTATIAPPEPFDVTLPNSAAEDPSEAELSLWMDASGRISWDGLEGPAAIAALAKSEIGIDSLLPLIVRADRNVPAIEVARLLRELSVLGITNAQLVTEGTP